VDTGESGVRITEMPRKCQRIGKILLESCRSNPVKHGQLGVQVIQRFCVGHESACFMGKGSVGGNINPGQNNLFKFNSKIV
jgi:hypothetical protein